MGKTGGKSVLNIMWKTIRLKNKTKKLSNQGFITIEIIIALLIAFGFLMVSLQTLVLGMVFKVQAQEEQKADKLIQEDIEAIQDRASGNTLTPRLAAILTDNDDPNTGLNSATNEPIDDVCNASTYAEGYAQALWFAYTNQDYNGDNIYSSNIIDDTDVDNAANPNIDDIPPDPMDLNDTILTNPDYEDNPTMSLLSIVSSTGTQQLGKTLTLNRTHVTANTGVAPFRTLGIYYQVTKPDEDGDGNPDVIANRYVEVTPDAALECP